MRATTTGHAAAAVVLALAVAACGGSAGEPVDGSPAPPATPAPAGPTAPVPAPTEPGAPPPATAEPPATAPAPAPSLPAAPPPAPAPAEPPVIGPALRVPPSLEVFDPAPGATVGARTLLFRGTTDPGCIVTAAGRYAAEVDETGNWAIVLVLNPGGNVAVFEATDPRGASTKVRVPVFYEPLLLRADGLGPVDFRAPMEPALAAFVNLFGPPDRDDVLSVEDYVAEYGDEALGMFTAIGYPAKTYARFVEWERLGIQAMFSDYVNYETEGAEPMFNGWIATGRRFVTATGVGVGSSRADFEAAYGEAFTRYPEQEEITGAWHFTIDSGLPGWYPDETLRLYGRFAGDPADPSITISQVQGGFGFAEC